MLQQMAQLDNNICPRARAWRLRGGILVIGVGLLLGVALVKAEVPMAVRALVFVPFFAGSFMVLQAAFRTCVFRAARRERETNAGVERVWCHMQSQVDRGRAGQVLSASVGVALLATALLVLLP